MHDFNIPMFGEHRLDVKLVFSCKTPCCVISTPSSASGLTPGEIFSCVIEDFSVSSFLRNDMVICATEYQWERGRIRRTGNHQTNNQEKGGEKRQVVKRKEKGDQKSE
jgi:hypothetical protein